jgi:hypothetical protein
VSVSTQPELQFVRLAGQATAPLHCPMVPFGTQSWRVHLVPHAPQCDGSLARFTHAVPPLVAQEVSPGRHTQVPLLSQASVFEQTVPQAPQASGLVLGEVVQTDML